VWDSQQTLSTSSEVNGAGVNLSSKNGTICIATLGELAKNSIVSLDHVIVNQALVEKSGDSELTNASFSVNTLNPVGMLGDEVTPSALVNKKTMRWPGLHQGTLSDGPFVVKSAPADVMSVTMVVGGEATLTSGKLTLVLRLGPNSGDLKN
jgi:hypothetical protein